jgi:hypothetical protein
MKKILLAILVCLFSNPGFSLSYTMEVSEKELQKKVQAFMPLTQKNNLVSVTLKNPVIDIMKDTNKIGLSSAIDATALGGIKGNGIIDVAGNIVYNKDQGAFFLQNIEVLDFKSDKINDSYKDIVKVLAQQLLNTALKAHPIYQFDTSKTEGKIAKSSFKSVKIRDEKLLLKMGM